ncbi:competence type IV pilus assembly protein ComGB [Lederbergia panacisoli]|uniref:competence type IV pilus assembly protein ComGB n=1 Tax=Lederbergia panacisoli TaxID=1255251 RepID=UPI00214C44E6|nr:competence type IV pilus assembly protein ComGB [Lederbergia panacisoli]MCR2820385.1 competence type IV pilus assembly protein ComGB [Lederbergia panacisoli]
MAIWHLKNMSVGLLRSRQKLTLKEQGIFLSRASEMLKNGFTLLEVLHFFGKLEGKNHQLMDSMINDLKSGHKIHEVFLKHHFDQGACVQLFFSEKHGFLADALLESGEYLQRMDEERKKLLKLMQYPLILIFILLFVGILLNTLLLPRFQNLYQSMGYEPTIGIKLVLHLMQNIPYYLLLIFIVCFVLFSILKWIFQKKSALEIASVFSSFPLINSIYKLYQTNFIAREWGYLLRSGFSINEIITIMESQMYRPLLQESAQQLKKMLLVGHSFGDALSKLSFIEKEMILIVNHGDKNGRVDKELLYYSQHCLQKLQEKTENIFLIIQPIIFSFIGLVVIAIYMSIFFPMFQMLDSI